MSIYDIEVTHINGNKQQLSDYRDRYMVIVNTASQCGLVGQLEDLEELYQTFKEEGVVVLGFPSNQFMNQEPLGNEEIQTFCETTYNVSFPLFEKIDVNGDSAHPLYQYLVKETKNKKIKWNFTKFLVAPEEASITRFAPTTSPKKVKKEIELLIKSN
ncbi:glutathione peroxidase [Alkalibacterium iburiense]|uniref:Glutathione peroxidase n=1 Tax=Alkalibacterium iburiense TaxID=290589 RepID=A0ABN0XBW8_9LACT